jgi:hypothetical protein
MENLMVQTQTKRRPSKTATQKPRRPRKWSAKVTETSDAMDLEAGVFRFDSPERIAASLKRSAERSHRRKSTPFRSAMSMLNFYINRAGRILSAPRRRALDAAKEELRRRRTKTTLAPPPGWLILAAATGGIRDGGSGGDLA